MLELSMPGWICSAFVLFYLFPVMAVGLTLDWRWSKNYLPWNKVRAMDMDEMGELRFARYIPVFNLYAMVVGVFQMRRQLRRAERDFIRQHEHFQVILSEDHRWMAHSPVVDALTTRYRDAWDEHWQTKVFKRVDRLRRDLNLEPQYADGRYRNLPVTTGHVLPGSYIPVTEDSPPNFIDYLVNEPYEMTPLGEAEPRWKIEKPSTEVSKP